MIFKFTDEKTRILNELETHNEFKRREQDPFWQTIAYIQTTVKVKIGLGKCFSFNFVSPCFKKDEKGNFETSYDGELEFNYK